MKELTTVNLQELKEEAERIGMDGLTQQVKDFCHDVGTLVDSMNDLFINGGAGLVLAKVRVVVTLDVDSMHLMRAEIGVEQHDKVPNTDEQVG